MTGTDARKITWHPDGAPPGDAPKERLFALHDRMPTPALMRALLVDNPARLYGFGAAA